jgi:putative tryptophan/tyrosine transport system substrate-binding protein
VDALVVFPSPNFVHERRRIVRLALERRWPLAGPRHEYAEEGGLLAYGIDVMPQFRRAAYYAVRILNGAKAGDLPVEQPTTVDLVVNVRTAKSLGIAVPAALLARAHRVIQ